MKMNLEASTYRLLLHREDFQNLINGLKSSVLYELEPDQNLDVGNEILVIESKSRLDTTPTGNSIMCYITYTMRADNVNDRRLVLSLRPNYRTLELARDR